MIPKKVRICGQTWTVKRDPTLHARTGDVGQMHPQHRLIVIDSTPCIEYQADTLCHEIFHSIFSLTQGHKLSDEQEEEVVRILEVFTLGVLRDNPELRKLFFLK